MNTEEIKELSHLLGEFFKDHPWKICAWLLSDNPNFGIPPAYLCYMGKSEKVLKFARAAAELNTKHEAEK